MAVSKKKSTRKASSPWECKNTSVTVGALEVVVPTADAYGGVVEILNDKQTILFLEKGGCILAQGDCGETHVIVKTKEQKIALRDFLDQSIANS